MHRRSKSAHRVILLVVFCCGAAGCAYDWEVGSSSSSDAGNSGSGGGGAGGNDAGADCSKLGQAIVAARQNAKSCTLGVAGQCGASVVDENGCTSYVKDGASAAAAAYADAVAAFEAAGCTPPGGTCMPAATGTCLLSAGQGPYCLP